MRWSGKVKFLLGCFLALGSEIYAQDAHFSQQYATRLQLNPAFAGLTAEASASAAYRNQWPSLSGAFVTNYLSGDVRLGESKSSLGAQMLLDQSGSAGFTQFGFNGIYSYRTRISKNFAVSAGLQAGYGSQKVDFTNLTFGDQFTADGLQNEVSAETNTFDPVRYLTLGTGGILYSDQLWLSISANHLNQPDLGNTTESRLPLKVILNGGYKFYAYTHYSENKFYELSFTPTVTYIKHGPFSRTDLGFYTLYTPVSVGILYRGVPVGGAGTEQSLVFIGGIQLNAFRMAYSYDLGLSGLSTSTGGAHEISLAFHLVDYTKIFKNRARNKNSLEIACPAF